ncbi:BlaI/MecI/CopY family transcriptional regulator [Geothrix oryzisoli]|uniref:BlaI/MecI/CopY family transcriptional regulator n=1 Tax=Geothrix oryzisoli TaxID=2922721 RepID=UPI001FAE71D9|nr:BlaI/MecI/CopY family transcriptional regulator [Geothrix oryzisoli]
MKRPLKPTDVELKFLRVLWDLGPSTVKEVHACLNRREVYAYTGVLRMLQVMLDKGLVTRDERQRSHVYAPAHSRSAMEGGLVADLTERLFGGSAGALVLAALRSGEVSPEEKARIRELLSGEE